MGISVKLEVFEGPLDLLLHLIDKNKVSIYDIPIVRITEQYLDYIKEMEKQDLNIVSEFLVMAATLIDIKCRMLLPREKNEKGEEEDPRQELVEKLLEYKKYKYMSLELKDRQIDADRVMYKKPTIPEEVKNYVQPVEISDLLGNLTLYKMNQLFKVLMKRQEDRIDPVRSKYGDIPKEEINLEEKMNYIYCAAQKKKCLNFFELFEKSRSKMEVVVTFLAVLELIKGGSILVLQEHVFSEIIIRVKEAA